MKFVKIILLVLLFIIIWYNLFNTIATEGDTKLRILIALKPNSNLYNQ